MSTETLIQHLPLEAAAQAVADQTSTPPFITDLGPEKGRALLAQLQAGEGVRRPDMDVDDFVIDGGPHGQVQMRLLKPIGAPAPLPVILYLHGAGWVFGDRHTHDRLVRELAVGAGAAVVFPDYVRAPDAKYPAQNEEAYTAAQWIVAHGAEKDLDASRIVVVGDSCGGNMTAVTAINAKLRGGPEFRAQVLLYPVTDANFDTDSYREFGEGYYLRRDMMQWFWDQYTTDPAQREEITCSPLRATLDDLAGLPPALVITNEADVLRDEGEAYARKLRAAGVDVTATRYEGIIHDMMMLDAMRDTNAAKAATEQAAAFIARHLA